MRAIVFAVLLAAAGRAEAQPTADAHARRGVALYNLGKYEEAIGEFEQAYTLVQSDALLFNLAQAHRQLGHCEVALQYYKRFMAGSPAPALAAQVEALLPKLEAACRTKLEQPAGPAPAPEPAPTTETAAAPPNEEIEEELEDVVEVAEPRVRFGAALTGGSVISNKSAPTAGVAAEVATPVPWVRGAEVGVGLGAARLWRAEGERVATLSHAVATVRFASEQPWARLSVGAAVGAAHISSLDTSSGVVPGVRRAGLWMPLVRGELGAEHRIARGVALHVALVVGASPRSGPMLESMTQVGLHVGVRFER